jgi:hypothetical protein
MPVSEFICRERERAAAWKRSTADLLDEARAPVDHAREALDIQRETRPDCPGATHMFHRATG